MTQSSAVTALFEPAGLCEDSGAAAPIEPIQPPGYNASMTERVTEDDNRDGAAVESSFLEWSNLFGGAGVWGGNENGSEQGCNSLGVRGGTAHPNQNAKLYTSSVPSMWDDTPLSGSSPSTATFSPQNDVRLKKM